MSIGLNDCSNPFYYNQFADCVRKDSRIRENPEWKKLSKEQVASNQLNMCCEELACQDYSVFPLANKWCPEHTKKQTITQPHFGYAKTDKPGSWVGVL